MNILILGGNRYFGKAVTEKLLNKNNSIYLVNRNSKKIDFNHKKLTHIMTDRNNLQNFKHLFEDIIFDHVFDNIAYKLQDVIKLHKLLNGKIKHYIFTSSVITYLDSNDNYDATEKDWFKGRLNKNWILKKNYRYNDINYAINKKKIENYLIKNNKVKYTILRIPNVIGNNDFSQKTKRLLAFSKLKMKSKFLDNESFIQFILKEDLVNVILKILKKKNTKSKIYNVANKKIKIKDFYLLLKKKLKRNNDFNFKGKDFPFPVNSLMNCNKVKKELRIKFSSINKVIKSIQ